MLQTEILSTQQIERAVELLKKGELVALPTETVYGLAADAGNNNAINKIFAAKERPLNHPLILHLDSKEKLNDWILNSNDATRMLAEQFWPGPLTIIFNKQPGVSDVITGGLNTIAIRVPNHPVMLAVIKGLSGGVVAPSANTYTKTSPTKTEHVLKTLQGRIAAVMEGGISSVGIESTIIDMTKEKPIILRHGPITKTMIESVLQCEVNAPIHHSEKVSGNMKNHYQPDKPLFLVSKNNIGLHAKEDQKIAIVHYSKISKQSNFVCYQLPKDKSGYARILYHTLHEIDKTDVTAIFVENPPDLPEWIDVNDRLLKAATK